LRRLSKLGPALVERDFALLWLALLGMGVSVQMLEVAIGWQVYTNHRSALNLGLIGLAEFIPMFALALPAGQLADRISRRLILGCSLLSSAAVGAGLVAVSVAGVTAIAPFLALAFGSGTAYAIGIPAARALPAALVTEDLLESAMTLRSIATQASQVLGPALGGLLYPLAPGVVYGVSAVVCVAAAGSVAAMRRSPVVEAAPGAAETPGLGSVLAGLRFIGRTQILFGAIRSTFWRCCPAARSRCCRCLRARSCTWGQWGWACCAAPPRSARSWPRRCSRAARSAGAPGARCSWSWARSARALSCSASRARSRSRSPRSPSAERST